MKKYFLHMLLTLHLFNTNLVLAQQTTFNKVELPVGSFSGLVGGIAQDNNGYMWLATKGGLYRYDGYRYEMYANDPSDPYSISTISLETVYADPNGIIWVVTYVNGVDRLDPATGKFTHFRHQPNDPGSLSSDTVRAILVDREGILWIGTHRGLDRFDPKAGNFKHYQHNPDDPYSLSSNQVRKIYEDKQGTLWVGTGSVWRGEGGETDEGGLNRFDKNTGKFIRYLHAPNDPRSLINNKVQAIFEDSRGTFWVGTAGDGLHSMDRRAGTFQRHLYDPANPQGLSRPPVNETLLFSDHITFITEDALGSIWIGTLGNGLNRYDPDIGKTEHYRRDTNGFMENSGWTSCNSKDGILWISTWEGELYRVDPYRKNISRVSTASPVFAFSEDAADQLWIGTAQGIVVKNKKSFVSKNLVHDPSNQNSLSNNLVRCLFRDREGIMWVGGANGLNRFNAQYDTFTRWQNKPGDSSSISAGQVFKITEAGDNFLWIGTGSGLDLMNKRTGTFTHFKNNANDTSSLSRNQVISLLSDPSGNLWVGTALAGGLNYFDRKTGVFKHFLKGKSIFSLIQDSGGVLWVGTDEGLFWTNNPANGFNRFTDPGSGMGNTRVGSIQVGSIHEDDRKNIWVRTPAGIYRINPLNNQSTFFALNVRINNRVSDIGLLSLRNSYKGKNGEFYFGDANGYSVFSPDKLITNPNPPHVVLTDFRLKGKSVQPGTNSPLTEPLQSTEKISLSYNQNIFSFDFVGIHFSSPEHNRQLYRLENYDLEWREVGAEKTAYYYNVPPGHYAFKVKAASSGGVWAEKAIPIIISPPWWHTWWAYSLYGMFFVTGVYAVHRYQKQRVVAAERDRARVRELEQAKEIEKAYRELKITQTQLIQQEKMASLGELTAGIAHEIQNPLNFISNFTEVNTELLDEMQEVLRKGCIDEALTVVENVKDNSVKITEHSKRVDAIVKGMLQHSRSSTGEKQLTNLNALAAEYLRLAYHGFRGKDKDFTCTLVTDFDPQLEPVEVVPQEIGRVLLNLYNNAFYAVQQKQKQKLVLIGANGEEEAYKPTVSVATRQQEGLVEIRVRDNGVGIPESVKQKIFQPFFTTKPTGQGTGLGLSLSYDIIAKGHKGEIKVESREGEGTTLIIQLP